MLPSDNPFVDFTDANLSAVLWRAIRTIGVLAAVLFPVAWITAGWQSGVLLLVGALISAAGIYESQRLIAIVNAKLDNRRPPRSTALVVSMFLLRLTLAGGILYVSLRCLHGSAYALIAGLAFAIVALSVEAVRLVRS